MLHTVMCDVSGIEHFYFIYTNNSEGQIVPYNCEYEDSETYEYYAICPDL